MIDQQQKTALGFNGTDTLVTLGTAEALGLTGRDFTVEAWIKLASPHLDGHDFTVMGGDTATAGQGLQLLVRNGRLFLGFYANDTAGGTLLVPGVWFHVAFRYTSAGGGEQALFVNGVLDGQGTPRAAFAGKGAITLGQCFSSRFFSGVMSEVRIWSEARSEQQIQANLYRRLGGQEPNLSGYWPLDDGAGATARDARIPVDKVTGLPLPAASVVMHDGQVHQAAWVPGDAPLRTVPPAVEPADVVLASFGGASSSITIALRPESPPVFDMSAAISVEAWVRPAAIERPISQGPVVSKHGTLSGWELRASGSQASFMVTVGKVYREATMTGLVPNRWYHLAGVYDGQGVHLYVNGVLRARVGVTGPIDVFRGTPSLGWNSYWPDRRYAGEVAEVRVWSVARSQAALQQALFRRLAGDETGLSAVWRLEGDVSDASLNHNGGAAQGDMHWTVGGAPLPVTLGPQPAATTPDQQEILRLHGALRDSQAVIDTLNRERDAIMQENARLGAQVVALQQARAQQNTALAGLTEASTQQLATIAALQAQIAQKDARIGEIAKGGGAQTLLEDFVKNANAEITRAREELQRSGSNYQLGRVDLQVKMLPGPGGVGMRFPQIDELKLLSAEHLSNLNLGFESQQAKAAPKVTALTVPSVIGYTEVVARRKLAEAGFVVETGYQAVTSNAGELVLADRVVHQFPRPEAAAAAGSTISIYIGRQS
jgi:hypothetical protein